MPGSRRLCAAIWPILVASIPGCAFPSVRGPFGPDPFEESLEPVSERYRESWLRFPTGLGNIVGTVATAPVALFLVAPIEYAVGTGDEAEATMGVMAAGGYGLGFLLGSPFLLLHWGFYGFWAENWDYIGGTDESDPPDDDSEEDAEDTQNASTSDDDTNAPKTPATNNVPSPPKDPTNDAPNTPKAPAKDDANSSPVRPANPPKKEPR